MLSLTQLPQPLSQFFRKADQRLVVKEVRCFGWLREGQGLLLEVCYHGAWFVIPAEKYTHENGVMVYDCIVDHFNQKRMLVTYDDKTYVSSAPISLNSLRNDNTVRAYDLGTCPACFTETDYIVNKYTAYSEFYEVVSPCFYCCCCSYW